MPVLARILRAGLVAALAVAVGGWTFERLRFGATDAQAALRVQAETQARFDAGADALGRIAVKAAALRTLIRASGRDPEAARQLFDALTVALSGEDTSRTGITIYDAVDTPIAWAGRVSDPPRNLAGPATLSLASDALGPRLVRLDPVVDTDRRPATRIAAIVAEQVLESDSPPTPGDGMLLSTSLAPVHLRIEPPTNAPATGRFVVRAQGGGVLAQAEVSPADLAGARSRWRHGTGAAVLAVLAIALLLCSAPLVERRRRATTPGATLAAAAAIVFVLLAARLLLRLAAAILDAGRPLTEPLDLFLTSLVAAALVGLALDVLEGRRPGRERATLLRPDTRGTALVASVYFAVGIVCATLLWLYGRYLQSVVARTTVDLLHFSLHPLDPARIALAFALLMLHAAAIWGMVALVRLPRLVWRLPHGRLPMIAAVAWSAGALVGALVAAGSRAPVPALPLLVALATSGAGALAVARLRAGARRRSQGVRLAGFFLALLLPAFALYPSLSSFSTEAKERLIANDYGPQALAIRANLQQQMRRSLDEIDNLRSLPGLVTAPIDPDTPAASRAFSVWSRTGLEATRLTSAVELYREDGRLVSRFALHLPEYTATPYTPAGCDWTLVEDVSSIGASEPHVLRASRGVCVRGRIVGGVIVRAMLDFRTLPFASPQTPTTEYWASSGTRADRQAGGEAVAGRDVEFAVYGWSRAPTFASGSRVWTVSDDVFQRTVESRAPFWDSIERDGERFRIYVMNDRGGVYLLGYPVITLMGHLINLAELVTLALVLFVLLVASATLFNVMSARSLGGIHTLLREVRSSFYRKLLFAFWAAAVVPVAILAFAIRTYFAAELSAGVEDAAAKTVTVAQRLVEDYATLQQRGTGTLEPLDDEIMVLVSRAIDEDVNLFDRAHLQATSAYDLFASEQLSPRTPADVYRALVLDRAPTFVRPPDFGTVPYVLAAAPVRTAGREGLVTVPVTLRQREIEQQLDELDRRVLFGAVLFSLLGGALGYWMAARIANPVNRLARATRRIARGDLDARLTATSSDELGRLVADFNRMAADLKRQRRELERTQRLEAWAEMARQVAHDIKNPLTPIQLSAEHAQRINNDHGRPLSPVLDECVTAILGQVRLLRQIATEFSSFASSPTAHLAPTALVALVDEVVSPYRTGLAGRVTIDVEAPADLPRVTVDRTLIARALTNIIENALHAMPGRGHLNVVVRLAAPAEPSKAHDVPGGPRGFVEVQITDTGVGMDDEALAKIFEPYFSTKTTGTGLGLTIAKRNVELNGGTIGVTSERGVGTTVTIRLPIETASI